MSEALERVIAEQQAHIDHMKSVIDSQQNRTNTVFTRHGELFESFARLLDAEIPKCSPDQKGDVFEAYRKLRHDARMQMMDAGYCLHCYNFVCECEGQYD